MATFPEYLRPGDEFFVGDCRYVVSAKPRRWIEGVVLVRCVYNEGKVVKGSGLRTLTLRHDDAILLAD